jgi:hypothetical protein
VKIKNQPLYDPFIGNKADTFALGGASGSQDVVALLLANKGDGLAAGFLITDDGIEPMYD